MTSVWQLKEQEVTDAPLLLFECELSSGQFERWSTHQVTVEGNTYAARVLKNNLFDVRAGAEDGIHATSKVSVTLANADSRFSEIERNTGWKGARLTARFVFVNLRDGTATTDSQVVFRGVANPPDEITESTFRLTFSNRLCLQRLALPEVRIQKRCPWMFPATTSERQEAATGGARGKYSPLFRCGYSPDVEGGAGSPAGAAPFTTCDYSKGQCEERGMYRTDGLGQPTARFGGIQYLPPSIEVRSHGEDGRHIGWTIDNAARYNDVVPLVYGAAWYEPPIIFARNDGTLTHLEALLGMGEMNAVIKVIANGVEVPAGQAGVDMTGTGWFNIVSLGSRNGAFNADFQDADGNAAGDPYGGMAVLSVVLPNRISDGRTLPKIEVLAEGMKLPRYGTDGNSLGEQSSNNPAWVILDLLRRSGWELSEIDIASFARTAQHCDELIQASDLHGNPVSVPRYQCNLVVRRRRSAADIIRGVRTGAALLLGYGPGGLLELRAEATLAVQQPEKPEWSNATEQLAGGWPAYEFGDGSSGVAGILRRAGGEPTIRVWARSTADSPNRSTLEFQDSFNDYQQDTLSLVDIDDVLRAGQEVTAGLPALGVPNFSQAARVIRLRLNKAVHGNYYVEFQTSVRGLGLRPGDLITVTYLKEGLDRQPFRVVRIAPDVNYRTTTIAAQIHSDDWYLVSDAISGENRRQPEAGLGIPRPLGGTRLSAEGDPEFDITESAQESADGSMKALLQIDFPVPAKPQSTSAAIPLISLAATASPAGGTLGGGRTLYYAISAVDASGNESRLSFIVRATIPPGSETNSVTLTGLSFSSDTTAFHVYRGADPYRLLRIAPAVPVSDRFVDTGATVELQSPPDENYDHANFYWRLELQPEVIATIHSTTTIGNDHLQSTENQYRGAVVRLTGGRGKGQERAILANTATTLTVAPAWVVQPDETSRYVVAESGWRFGAMAYSSPVQFEVPNREGATVHISGRAANVNDKECAYELSPLTRWDIGGSAGNALDSDIPPKPAFGVARTGKGTVELMGIGFVELMNTRSIAAGTVTLRYWDEVSGPTPIGSTSAIGEADVLVDLVAPGNGTQGDCVQIDSEVLVIEEVLNAGSRYRVERAAVGSTAAGHDAGALVYQLARKIDVVAFPRDFFGSPASGDFSHSIAILDARLAAAEFFVTNSRGNSPVAARCLTGTVDRGVRTLAGGQLSLQIDGYLAVQTGAVPPLVVDTSRRAGDVFAIVQEPPAGGPIELRIKQNGTDWCTLTIGAGVTTSNDIDGFALPVLEAQAQLTLDVVSVGAALPGRDLTVTIRL